MPIGGAAPTPNGSSPAASACDLAAIVDAYTEVTEKLKLSHERLAAEVRRLNDQLDEKNRELARRERLSALGEMAAGVAHEIRNPLAGIQLFASLLERDLATAPSTHDARPSGLELARRISAAVRTLDGVVGDILVFAGKAPAEFVPVDLIEIVREVAALVVPLLESREVTLHAQQNGAATPSRSACGAAHGAIVVWADAGQIQRALLNLVRNAIDAVELGGNVWIGLTPADSPDSEGEPRVRVSVSDDGPGVPEASRQRIFDPFFTTRAQGTGLGLSIVHRIVEAHGGSISVGRRDGGGAVFAFTLPLARATQVADSRSLHSAEPHDVGREPQELIREPQKLVRESQRLVRESQRLVRESQRLVRESLLAPDDYQE